MLKKTHRTQFFDYFEYSDNYLIINPLHPDSSFSFPNITLESPTFKFPFKHSAKAEIIHFLTFQLKPIIFYFEERCFFIFSALSSNFQRTENKIAAHCG